MVSLVQPEASVLTHDLAQLSEAEARGKANAWIAGQLETNTTAQREAASFLASGDAGDPSTFSTLLVDYKGRKDALKDAAAELQTNILPPMKVIQLLEDRASVAFVEREEEIERERSLNLKRRHLETLSGNVALAPEFTTILQTQEQIDEFWHEWINGLIERDHPGMTTSRDANVDIQRTKLFRELAITITSAYDKYPILEKGAIVDPHTYVAIRMSASFAKEEWERASSEITPKVDALRSERMELDQMIIGLGGVVPPDIGRRLRAAKLEKEKIFLTSNAKERFDTRFERANKSYDAVEAEFCAEYDELAGEIKVCEEKLAALDLPREELSTLPIWKLRRYRAGALLQFLQSEWVVFQAKHPQAAYSLNDAADYLHADLAETQT